MLGVAGPLAEVRLMRKGMALLGGVPQVGGFGAANVAFGAVVESFRRISPLGDMEMFLGQMWDESSRHDVKQMSLACVCACDSSCAECSTGEPAHCT